MLNVHAIINSFLNLWLYLLCCQINIKYKMRMIHTWRTFEINNCDRGVNCLILMLKENPVMTSYPTVRNMASVRVKLRMYPGLCATVPRLAASVIWTNKVSSVVPFHVKLWKVIKISDSLTPICNDIKSKRGHVYVYNHWFAFRVSILYTYSVFF